MSSQAPGQRSLRCGTLPVPLNYRQPAGRKITLALSEIPATAPPAEQQGVLLVNPGGPGGSAVGYLQSYAGVGYPADVRARYDMVAVDPRGVARSEPVECLDGRQMDTYTQTDLTPDDQWERNALVTADRKFAESCGARSARLLRHVCRTPFVP